MKKFNKKYIISILVALAACSLYSANSHVSTYAMMHSVSDKPNNSISNNQEVNISTILQYYYRRIHAEYSLFGIKTLQLKNRKDREYFSNFHDTFTSEHSLIMTPQWIDSNIKNIGEENTLILLHAESKKLKNANDQLNKKLKTQINNKTIESISNLLNKLAKHPTKDKTYEQISDILHTLSLKKLTKEEIYILFDCFLEFYNKLFYNIPIKSLMNKDAQNVIYQLSNYTLLFSINMQSTAINFRQPDYDFIKLFLIYIQQLTPKYIELINHFNCHKNNDRCPECDNCYYCGKLYDKTVENDPQTTPITTTIPTIVPEIFDDIDNSFHSSKTSNNDENTKNQNENIDKTKSNVDFDHDDNILQECNDNEAADDDNNADVQNLNINELVNYINDGATKKKKKKRKQKGTKKATDNTINNENKPTTETQSLMTCAENKFKSTFKNLKNNIANNTRNLNDCNPKIKCVLSNNFLSKIGAPLNETPPVNPKTNNEDENSRSKIIKDCAYDIIQTKLKYKTINWQEYSNIKQQINSDTSTKFTENFIKNEAQLNPHAKKAYDVMNEKLKYNELIKIAYKILQTNLDSCAIDKHLYNFIKANLADDFNIEYAKEIIEKMKSIYAKHKKGIETRPAIALGLINRDKNSSSDVKPINSINSSSEAKPINSINSSSETETKSNNGGVSKTSINFDEINKKILEILATKDLIAANLGHLDFKKTDLAYIKNSFQMVFQNIINDINKYIFKLEKLVNEDKTGQQILKRRKQGLTKLIELINKVTCDITNNFDATVKKICDNNSNVNDMDKINLSKLFRMATTTNVCAFIKQFTEAEAQLISQTEIDILNHLKTNYKKNSKQIVEHMESIYEDFINEINKIDTHNEKDLIKLREEIEKNKESLTNEVNNPLINYSKLLNDDELHKNLDNATNQFIESFNKYQIYNPYILTSNKKQ